MAYTAAFKFKLVLEALTCADSDKELAEQNSVHPVTLSRWKQQFLEDGKLVFETDKATIQRVRNGGVASTDEELSMLRCVTEYVCDNHLGIDEKVDIVRALEPRFGLNQVCHAVGLAKSTWYYRTNQDVQSSA
jgi:transposase-like protein